MKLDRFLQLSFVIALLLLSLLGITGYSLWAYKTLNFPFELNYQEGEPIDTLHSVNVFYNGPMRQIHQRNLTEEGYNLGLQYQCVEFVRRYYWEHYQHQMPNSWGNAKDFYNPRLKDGAFNEERGLLQFSNPSQFKPNVGDLLIFDGTLFNSYGHVAIISEVNEESIEIIQQNSRKSRENILIYYDDNRWVIKDSRVLGRLSINEEINGESFDYWQLLRRLDLFSL